MYVCFRALVITVNGYRQELTCFLIKHIYWTWETQTMFMSSHLRNLNVDEKNLQKT